MELMSSLERVNVYFLKAKTEDMLGEIYGTCYL